MPPLERSPPLRATLRVFSSSPRSLVYVNEQRLGATPDDTLEPFVTPELAVGRYWIRVVSTDGELEWEGEKEVLDGNVNSLEATLASAEESIWGRAIASMAQGDLPAARASCEKYRLRFAMGVHIDEAIELLRAIDSAADRSFHRGFRELVEHAGAPRGARRALAVAQGDRGVTKVTSAGARRRQSGPKAPVAVGGAQRVNEHQGAARVEVSSTR